MHLVRCGLTVLGAFLVTSAPLHGQTLGAYGPPTAKRGVLQSPMHHPPPHSISTGLWLVCWKSRLRFCSSEAELGLKGGHLAEVTRLWHG